MESTHAAVTANTSDGLAFVTNLRLTAKPEVNSPITIKRIKIDVIEYKTMMEATGSNEARTVPTSAVTRAMPACE